jgi:hypothetical protein
MQIVVVKASPEVNKGKYKEFELVFKKDGKVEGKKFFSFNYPEVYASILAAKEGDSFNVVTEQIPGKDGNKYWQWTSISPSGTPVAQSSTPTTHSVPEKAARSNWETPEERAAKQRYIVKQSSLSLALSLLQHNDSDREGKITSEQVIKLADEFVNYVFHEDATQAIVDMKDDLPF